MAGEGTNFFPFKVQDRKVRMPDLCTEVIKTVEKSVRRAGISDQGRPPGEFPNRGKEETPPGLTRGRALKEP
jgi:hypothetical protein